MFADNVSHSDFATGLTGDKIRENQSIAGGVAPDPSSGMSVFLLR